MVRKQKKETLQKMSQIETAISAPGSCYMQTKERLYD